MFYAAKRNARRGVILAGTTLGARRSSGRVLTVVPFVEKNSNSRTCNKTRNRVNSNNTSTPCNLYIGENFATRLQAFFEFEKSVRKESERGLVTCNFDPFRGFGDMKLSQMAERMKNCPNAGGNSVESEVLSLELLHRCYGAQLLKTEMEIQYFPHGGSITDYTCELFGARLGVSVTRAMKYKGEFAREDAEKLLGKKLRGILNATQNTLEKWSKQILHIWATSKRVADVLTSVYWDMSPSVTANTVVLVTVVTRPEHSLFRNSR